MFQYLLFLIVCLSLTNGHRKNTCNTFRDYAYVRFNKHCWYNPDVEADMPQLVKQYGYPLETYSVITPDQYILAVYRLPNKNPKKVVYLQHNAFSSCTVWLDKGNASLAYILYHQGYDVWMGNFRGTYLSRKHQTKDPYDNSFWDFSYDEMGRYDMPATIDLIKSKSGAKKITVVGLSLSSAAAIIYSSLNPDHAVENVNGFILLAPPVFLHNFSSPTKYLTKYAPQIYGVATLFHQLEFMPHTKSQIQSMSYCTRFPFAKFCSLQMNVVFGDGEIYPPYIPIQYFQATAGISLKVFYHFAQSANAGGNFNHFDYGKKHNKHKYGSPSAPPYPVKNIRSKVYMIYGDRDNIVINGSLKFYNQLPSDSQAGIRVVKGFNHINFAYAKETSLLREYTYIADLLNNNIFNT